jgi:hypothetical protein
MFNFKSFKVQFCWFVSAVVAVSMSIANIIAQVDNASFWVIIFAINSVSVYSWFTEMLENKDFAKLMGKDGSEEA